MFCAKISRLSLKILNIQKCLWSTFVLKTFKKYENFQIWSRSSTRFNSCKLSNFWKGLMLIFGTKFRWALRNWRLFWNLPRFAKFQYLWKCRQIMQPRDFFCIIATTRARVWYVHGNCTVLVIGLVHVASYNARRQHQNLFKTSFALVSFCSTTHFHFLKIKVF